jgi:hypothetical protein
MMTLCAAWIRNQHVYLVADSAVTKNTPLASSRSHFGEVNEDEGGKRVEESALKIFRFEQTAIGFAGDADLASDIFKAYVRHAQSNKPKDSFELAWAEFTPFEESADKDRSCRAVLVFHDGICPRLVYFTETEITEPADKCAVFGSLDNNEAKDVIQMVQNLPSNYTEPDDVLSLSLVSFQRFSIFENRLKRGIGGHYAGVSIGAEGLRWMPPVLHLIFDGSGFKTPELGIPSVVAVYAVNDMVLLINDREIGWAVFLNSSGENLNLTSQQMAIKAEHTAKKNPIGHLQYRHVVIYDVKHCKLTALLVNGLVPSQDVFPRFETIGGESRFVIDMSSSMLEVLERDPETGTIAIHDCRLG